MIAHRVRGHSPSESQRQTPLGHALFGAAAHHSDRARRAIVQSALVVAVALIVGIAQPQIASASKGPGGPKHVVFHVAASTNPSSTANALSGVSCHGRAFCAAVGYYVTAGVDKTLVELFNGSRWTTSASTSPSLRRTISWPSHARAPTSASRWERAE